MVHAGHNQRSFDAVLVGGGLSAQLIALRLAELRPDVRVAIVERGAQLGGNHTWSFHDSDLDAAQRQWVAPLASFSWPAQRVMFPAQARELATGYSSITSEALARAVAELPSVTIYTSASAAELAPQRIRLDDGSELEAPLVIDARGALREQPLAVAYQKFVGLEVELFEPHGETLPVIMDATVAQHDGYRFVYTLPMGPTRILIEDTYYSDAPEIDRPLLEQRCRDYAQSRGWTIARLIRDEQGVLPIALDGDIDAHWATLGNEIPRAGLRAWLFNATTGYSLPLAVELADRIARAPELSSRAIARVAETLSREAWAEQAYTRMLNRLLFVGAGPRRAPCNSRALLSPRRAADPTLLCGT